MMRKTRQNKKGFTLIELLVTIIIIGILATLATVLYSSARMKARDVKRISDIKTMSTALQLYYEDEGHYPVADSSLGDPDGVPDQFIIGQPLASPSSGVVYLSTIPSNPSPRNEGNSNNPTESDYIYTSKDGSTYTIEFWLGSNVGDAIAGENVSLPDQPVCSADCTGKQCGDVCGIKSCGTCGSGLGCKNYQCVDTICIECTSANNLGDRCGGGILFSKNPNLVATPKACDEDPGQTYGPDCGVGATGYTCGRISSNDQSWYWNYPPVTADPGASDSNDGRNNATVFSNNDYEAGYFCNNLSLMGFNDYYLPAILELKAFYDSPYDASGDFLITGGLYLSSTQWSVDPLKFFAYAWIGSDPESCNNLYVGDRRTCEAKGTYNLVRCIRRPNF